MFDLVCHNLGPFVQGFPKRIEMIGLMSEEEMEKAKTTVATLVHVAKGWIIYKMV